MERKILALTIIIAGLISCFSGIFQLVTVFFCLFMCGALALVGFSAVKRQNQFHAHSQALDITMQQAEIMNRMVDAKCRAVVSSHGVLAFVDGQPQFYTRNNAGARGDHPPAKLFSGTGGGISCNPPIMPLIQGARTICLYGSQGSGKTTLLCHTLAGRAGEETLIIDPHGYEGKYPQGQMIGAGRNYEEINGWLEEIIGVINNRYQVYQGQTFEPLNVLIDEMTLLHANCDNFQRFMRIMTTESRKVGVKGVFCLHSRRAEFLGLKGGFDLAEDITFITLRNENGLRFAEVKQAEGVRRFSLPGPYHAGGYQAGGSVSFDSDTGHIPVDSSGYSGLTGLPVGYTAGGYDPVAAAVSVESDDDSLVNRIRDLRGAVDESGKPLSLNEITRRAFGRKNPQNFNKVKAVLVKLGLL